MRENSNKVTFLPQTFCPKSINESEYTIVRWLKYLVEVTMSDTDSLQIVTKNILRCWIHVYIYIYILYIYLQFVHIYTYTYPHTHTYTRTQFSHVTYFPCLQLLCKPKPFVLFRFWTHPLGRRNNTCVEDMLSVCVYISIFIHTHIYILWTETMSQTILQRRISVFCEAFIYTVYTVYIYIPGNNLQHDIYMLLCNECYAMKDTK